MFGLQLSKAFLDERVEGVLPFEHVRVATDNVRMILPPTAELPFEHVRVATTAADITVSGGTKLPFEHVRVATKKLH